MTLRLSDATFGCELELGDIDTKIEIPKSLGSWDYKDASVMNSNGTANDPKKILNRYGGEIQVKPSHSPTHLAQRVLSIYGLFPKKDFNFTTNLHVHIRISGLKEDLRSLKAISRYLRLHGRSMFELIDPIPMPRKTVFGGPEDYHDPKAFRGAWARYLRRKRSHHTLVSDRVYEKMMNAKTSEEFHRAHAPMSSDGKLQWHLVQRAGVNLAHLWKDTETIEFRCFTMSPDFAKLRSAFRWALFFVEAAIDTGDSPQMILQDHYKLRFQKFWPYNYRLDHIFQLTNVRHNKRSKAEANYRKLLDSGTICERDII